MTAARYTAAGFFASIGTIVLAVNVGGNLNEAMPGWMTSPTWETMIDAGLIALPSFVSAIFAVTYGRMGPIIGPLFVIIAWGSSASSVIYTIDRLGSIDANPALKIQAQNGRIKRSAQRLKQIEKQLNYWEHDESVGRWTQCQGFSPARGHTREGWPKCHAAKDTIAALTKQKAKLLAQRDDMGEVRDARKPSERFLDWLTDGQGGTIMAMLLPVGRSIILELCSLAAFLAAGHYAAARRRKAVEAPQEPVKEKPIITLTADEEAVVRALRRNRDGFTNRALAREMDWSEAKTSRLVDNLVANHYADRRQHGRGRALRAAARDHGSGRRCAGGRGALHGRPDAEV